MFTLALKGETRETHLVCADLTPIVDPHHGLHRKASAYHKKKVGRRSGEECEKIHSGTLTNYYLRWAGPSRDYARGRSRMVTMAVTRGVAGETYH